MGFPQSDYKDWNDRTVDERRGMVDWRQQRELVTQPGAADVGEDVAFIQKVGHNFGKHQVVAWDGANWVLADLASVAIIGDYSKLALVLAVLDADNVAVWRWGTRRLPDDFTVGDTYYLSSSTAGNTMNAIPAPDEKACELFYVHEGQLATWSPKVVQKSTVCVDGTNLITAWIHGSAIP